MHVPDGNGEIVGDELDRNVVHLLAQRFQHRVRQGRSKIGPERLPTEEPAFLFLGQVEGHLFVLIPKVQYLPEILGVPDFRGVVNERLYGFDFVLLGSLAESIECAVMVNATPNRKVARSDANTAERTIFPSQVPTRQS